MNKADYQRYLASREWAVLKEKIRERSGGHCERCSEGKYEQTHHVTYERVGYERPEDLLALCAACHEFLSAKSDEDPCDSATPLPRERLDVHGAISCFCGSEEFPGVPMILTGKHWVEMHVRCHHGHHLSLRIGGNPAVWFSVERAEPVQALRHVQVALPPTPKPINLETAWEDIVAEVTKRTALLGSVLRHASPLRVEAGALVVAVRMSRFHREILTDTNNAALMSGIIKERTASADRLELVDY